jgi:hypothetical protein
MYVYALFHHGDSYYIKLLIKSLAVVLRVYFEVGLFKLLIIQTEEKYWYPIDLLLYQKVILVPSFSIKMIVNQNKDIK